MKQRDSYWDVVKGIAIVSIVIGHAVDFLSPYVYLYHLSIFFFVGGYFYNEEKYGDAPFSYVGKLFQGVYFKYVGYTWLLLLLHNFCTRFGLYYNAGDYGWKELLYWICDALVFQNPEMFGGALWFIPVYLVVLSMLGFLVYLSRKVSSTRKMLKNVFLLLGAGIIGGAGVFLNKNGMELAFHIHTSLVVFPVVLIAYFVKKYIHDVKNYAKIWLAPIEAILIWCIVNILNWRIELSKEQIINGIAFYAVSILGIMFCLSLANCLDYLKWTRILFSFLGRYSYAIMALHFFMIKIVDRIYCFVIGEKDPAVIGAWVCSYSNRLWLVYVIVGSLTPALIMYTINRARRWIEHKILLKRR